MVNENNADLMSIKFNEQGLIPVVAQDAKDGTILMVAYMNQESFQQTVDTGVAVYWSRSRKKLWKKGESSGNVQKVKAIYTDCDSDVILLKIDQIGDAACHTGNRTCFYKELKNKQWVENLKPLFDPNKVYGTKK